MTSKAEFEIAMQAVCLKQNENKYYDLQELSRRERWSIGRVPDRPSRVAGLESYYRPHFPYMNNFIHITLFVYFEKDIVSRWSFLPIYPGK